MKLGPNQKAWIKALRSGQYKQGLYYLLRKPITDPQYCCLGVMMDVDPKCKTVPAHQRMPSNRVLDRWGLTKSSALKLASFNDGYKSFICIADQIEGNPGNFFEKSY